LDETPSMDSQPRLKKTDAEKLIKAVYKHLREWNKGVLPDDEGLRFFRFASGTRIPHGGLF